MAEQLLDLLDQHKKELTRVIQFRLDLQQKVQELTAQALRLEGAISALESLAKNQSDLLETEAMMSNHN